MTSNEKCKSMGLKNIEMIWYRFTVVIGLLNCSVRGHSSYSFDVYFCTHIRLLGFSSKYCFNTSETLKFIFILRRGNDSFPLKMRTLAESSINTRQNNKMHSIFYLKFIENTEKKFECFFDSHKCKINVRFACTSIIHWTQLLLFSRSEMKVHLLLEREKRWRIIDMCQVLRQWLWDSWMCIRREKPVLIEPHEKCIKIVYIRKDRNCLNKNIIN